MAAVAAPPADKNQSQTGSGTTAAEAPNIGRSKQLAWYVPSLTSVTASQRELLEKYSGVPAEEVLSHILAVREKAWEVFPYPCIGQFQFIDPCLPRSPAYAGILSRLRAGARLLDLGCCFAQDVRRLVLDGAPADNLYGVELVPQFLELSYELFRDRETLGAHLMPGDVFEDTSVEGSAMAKLAGRMDIIHVGLFLHLFDLPRQIEACEVLVRTLKPQPGVLVTGQQVGVAAEPFEFALGDGRRIYKHDPVSFAAMWREVGERTGSEWRVDVRVGQGLEIGEKQSTWNDPSTARLVYEIERVR